MPRLTIGTKLVALIFVLLVTSVAGLVTLSTRLFVEDNTALIQQMNSDSANALAAQLRETFLRLAEELRGAGSEYLKQGKFPISENGESQFVGFVLVDHRPDGSHAIGASALTPSWDPAKENLLTMVRPASNGRSTELSLESLAKGQVQAVAVTLPEGMGDEPRLMLLAVPLVQIDGKFTQSIVGFYRHSALTKIVGESSDVVTNFVVDARGFLVAHADQRATVGADYSAMPIVLKLLEGKFNNGQMRFVDGATQEPQLGAYRTVGFAGLSVVSEVAEAKAFSAAKRVVYQSGLTALIILCVAFFTGFYYSGTLTRPIATLVDASKRIASGDFKIALKPKGQDEIAHLSRAFNDMAKGLEERDRYKDTFQKFHSKEIAEKLLSGEVKLGGERKEAVIFFSDVRGFTAMSESMQPEQVVEMLNEYMSRMVSIIQKHNGVVDKYVGDAIMALWGVPIAKEEDTKNAIRACLEMRQELAKLNELRVSRGQNALKIGMGLNRGTVIAGNIGSNEKMEYTVIGDSVNLASRVESMTKEYGTDLLVSQSVLEHVADAFVPEEVASAQVKGKAQAVRLYKILGYVGADGKPVMIETPFSSYAAEKSDKSVAKPAIAEVAPRVEATTATVLPLAAAEAKTPARWFVQDGEETSGPFGEEDLLEAIHQGQFSEQASIGHAVSGPWKPLRDDAVFGTALRFASSKPDKTAA